MASDFWKVGHKPTLFAAFLYFDLAFMVWVILGPLGVQIALSLALTSAQKGLMVATPVLFGALLRVPMGLLADRLKPKMAGLIGQVVVLLALFAAWIFGIHSFHQVLVLGAALGMAGASFAVALPLASRWYPKEHQGMALGLAGAGNSGTTFAALFAPSLAASFGWNNVLGLIIIPLVLGLVIYMLLAKDSPQYAEPLFRSSLFSLLKEKDAWLLMFFYSITFGGFVGLASSLTIYFHDQYAVSAVTAGLYTALCVFFGSLVRPLGGWIADRIGGIKTLSIMFAAVFCLMLLLGMEFTDIHQAIAVFVPAMLALGMGNGAVFQLVPQRFGREIGTMTGIVGMAGGMGGFLLAAGLGYVKQLTDGYSGGFLGFAILIMAAFLLLQGVRNRWQYKWGLLEVAANNEI